MTSADARESISHEWTVAELLRENERLRANEGKHAAEMLSQLVAVTTGLFGPANIYESCDPEFPGDKYVVLAVQTAMPPEQAVAAERAWTRAIADIAPQWDSIRLLIQFPQ